jgi:hypothetical protein
MLLRKNSTITRHAEERTEGCQRTRMILKVTQISKKETITQKIQFFSLQIQMLQNLQKSQLVQRLLCFTNYHIHDYRGSRLYNKTLDESRQHTIMVFIGQRAVHIEWEHQQNKPDKRFH